MIERIKLLRNIGKFDSVDAGAHIPFNKLTLAYAENGRGKTTLAAVLRSLSTGKGELISERQRLSTTNTPHVVVSAVNGPYIFKDGAWSSNLPQLAIFDDLFVSQNVCSGIEIESEHRQNLHELILGAQGVTLNAELQTHVTKINEHNRELAKKSEAIPLTARGTFTVDDFCALISNPHIIQAIQVAERRLAAARSADTIRQKSEFSALELSAFDTEKINALLQLGLPGLEAEAATRVQSHFAKLGDGAEAWISNGMNRIASASTGNDYKICPFCAQNIDKSPLIEHYQTYFSEGYANLKNTIGDQIKTIETMRGADASFERGVHAAIQLRDFWKSFINIPDITLDTTTIAHTWNTAQKGILAALRTKQASPLDPFTLPTSVLEAIKHYDESCAAVAAISKILQELNTDITGVKEHAETANLSALTADLAKLKATEARHNMPISPLCQAYLDEKSAKTATEELRDKAREALDQYRLNVFPTYESTINQYLLKFNAGFKLGGVKSTNNRGGSSCTYNVVINDIPVAVTTTNGPSFRNMLSAGDRNTLALAFFFASLEQDSQLAQKIVVIDDPMTSLDEHRSLITVQEMRRLINRVIQVIVLSHSKPFLCALWKDAEPTTRSALMIARDETGSTLATWNANLDCITEHDQRHALVSLYIRNSTGDSKAVAAALRPILESFMRTAYPESFPPGTLLGPFAGLCDQRKGTPREILTNADIIELRDLLEYGNKFHHNTNPAWETEAINDQQLQQFAERTLRFARRA